VLSRRSIIGGLILFLALVFLSYKAFTWSVPYYYTVSELVSQGNSIYLQNVRVNGVVAPNTVEQEADSLIIRFTLTDGRERLPVIYHGAVPQVFEGGKEVVIEGKYYPQGFFEASTILTRCPSKYVPEKLDAGME